MIPRFNYCMILFEVYFHKFFFFSFFFLLLSWLFITRSSIYTKCISFFPLLLHFFFTALACGSCGAFRVVFAGQQRSPCPPLSPPFPPSSLSSPTRVVPLFQPESVRGAGALVRSVAKGHAGRAGTAAPGQRRRQQLSSVDGLDQRKLYDGRLRCTQR